MMHCFRVIRGKNEFNILLTITKSSYLTLLTEYLNLYHEWHE